MKKVMVGLALALLALAAWALPTLRDVESEVQRGNLPRAEAMMREVVAAKPESARAHYIYAEILARNGNYAQAAEEARLAQQADPQITFTQPEKFRSFEQLLDRELHPAQQVQPGRSQNTAAAPLALNGARSDGFMIPGWVWGLGLAALAVVAWRGFARSRSASVDAQGSVAPGTQYAGAGAYGASAPYSTGAGPGPGPMAAPGARSGMLGTGLAVAGGFAAGMLADELMHRRPDAATHDLSGLGPNALEPIAPDDAAAELGTRPVDFGTGPDWGGDAGSAADTGSFDVGGGSDDGWS